MERRYPLLFASLFALAGCAATVTSSDGAPSPGSSADGGSTGRDGGTAAPDPDDDDGPQWNGAVSSSPVSLAKSTTSYAVTRDDQVVFATSTGVSAVAATGGTPAALNGTAMATVNAAGRAALVRGPSSTTLDIWTKAGGLKPGGIALEASSYLYTYDTPSGDFALVYENGTGGKQWFLDAAAQTMTEVVLPSGFTANPNCRTSGETIACFAPNADYTQFALYTADRSGAHVLTTATGPSGNPPFVINGDVIYSDGESVYRIPSGTTTPVTLVKGGEEVVALQGNWLAVTVGDEVHVLKEDGSQEKTAATGGAHLESFDYDTAHDWARIKWVALCDTAADKMSFTNLRVYDPESGRLVPLSKTCDLRAITYSDNFAFVIDNAFATPNDPVLGEYGDPTVFDLRDGSSRGNPTGQDYFDHYAKPAGKDRFIFGWLSYGYFDNGCYYDGHSPASMPGAPFESPVELFGSFHLLAAEKGMLFGAADPARDDLQRDLYYLALP